VSRSSLQELLNRSSRDVLAYYEEPPIVLSNIVDVDDVRVLTQSAHCARFALGSNQAIFVYSLRLNQSYRNVAFEAGVTGQVDYFATAFTEKTINPVAAVRQGSRLWPPAYI